jgi:hypothetical protein
MSRIETWFRSKQAISDNPISWLSPKDHFEKYRKTVSGLNDEQLNRERARYNHNRRNDLIITGLATIAEIGAVSLVKPDPFVIALSFFPVVVSIGLAGITRGVFRDSEKRILQKEIVMRKIHKK